MVSRPSSGAPILFQGLLSFCEVFFEGVLYRDLSFLKGSYPFRSFSYLVVKVFVRASYLFVKACLMLSFPSSMLNVPVLAVNDVWGLLSVYRLL